MQNEENQSNKVKINRKLQMARAAQARAKITSYLNGSSAPYATHGELASVCSDIKGADMSNIVSRMVKNNLLSEIRLDKPIGRYRVAYTLFKGANTGEKIPRPFARTKQNVAASSKANSKGLDVKPSVVITDKNVTVDYPHIRIIIQAN